MKKSLYFSACFMLLICSGVFSQNVGIGTNTPAASAALDITGTNKGLLLPRISLKSEIDKTTIPTPAPALLVYNTNNNLPDSAGFYYWNGSKWLKVLTNTAAGGDLGGKYPNPLVSKLNGIALPAGIPTDNDYGKTLRYDPFTQSYELRPPVEFNENLSVHDLSLSYKSGLKGRILRSGDNASLIPVCYGTYNGSNALSGQTNNVTFQKVFPGGYQFHLIPDFYDTNVVFNPIIVCNYLGENNFGFIEAYPNGPYDFVIKTRGAALNFIDLPFSFVVYNR
jgi:hypothetical protein